MSSAYQQAFVHARDGRWSEAESICSQLLESEPAHREAWLLMGAIAHQKGNPARAIESLNNAIRLGLSTAEVFNNLGAAYLAAGCEEDAVQSCRRGLEVDPFHSETLRNLAFLLHKQGNLTEAESKCRLALQSNPRNVTAFNTLGNILKDLYRYDEALECCERALQLKPDDPDAHLHRALIWLSQGDFRQGWPEYEWRFRNRRFVNRQYAAPRWDGRHLPLATILIHAEQGFGDTLQFIRYAPWIKERVGTVVLACQASLSTLLASCSGVDHVIPLDAAPPHFDVQIPLLSVPLLAETTLGSIPNQVPYLFPDPGCIDRWAGKLAAIEGYRIGIAWRGSPTHQKDSLRSIDLAHYAPLASVPGVRLISLQKNAGAEQVNAVQDQFAVSVLEGYAAGTFADTAAIMRHLDLVITVDTSVAHLAGALGVPVCVALPLVPDWRWLLERLDSPWYPTMRLFRQQSSGDWPNVFARMARELPIHSTVSRRNNSFVKEYQEVFAVEPHNFDALRLVGALCLDRSPMEITRTFTLAQAQEEGIAAFKAGDFNTAIQIYNGVLQKKPQKALFWHLLSQALDAAGKPEQALAAVHKVIELEPDNLEAYSNVAVIAMKIDRPGEAEAALRRLLESQPGDLGIQRRLGDALYHVGKVRDALDLWTAIAERRPDDAQLRGSISTVRLLMGQFETGWSGYEWRLKTPRVLKSQVDLPRWQGESLDDKTILVMAEQGLGDTIQFIRYARELKSRWRCTVIVGVQKALMNLLAGVDGVDHIVSRDGVPPGCDCWVPLLSLPMMFKHYALEDFLSPGPYVSAKPQLVEQWRRRLARFGGVRIGIVWKGNTKNGVDRRRSVELTQFAPIGRLSGVTLISLQRAEGQEQLNALNGEFDAASFSDSEIKNFQDTAAIMMSLDLVISVDTAPCHLAGALGVPVWVPLPFIPDWRWQMRGDSTVWYPSMRLFRQTTAGDWNSVFERMAAALKEQYPDLRSKQPEEQVIATNNLNRLVRARHGLMLYNWRDQYVGRSLDRYGEYSEPECDLMRQVVRPGAWAVEAGANLGAHTVPLAKTVGPDGRVFAFEPQRVMFQTLCANIALNGLTNVDCRCAALGDAPGTLRVPPVDYHKTHNFGGLSLTSAAGPGEIAPVVTIDSLELARLDFLKLDVEGMELSVLKGARRAIEKFHPVLYFENDRAQNSRALLSHVISLGYVLYWHTPPLFSASNYFQNSRNEFGNTVSVNVLGIHSSFGMNISGLKKISSPDESWKSSTP